MKIRKILLTNLLGLFLIGACLYVARAETFSVQVAKQWFKTEMRHKKEYMTQKQRSTVLMQRAVAFNRAACAFASGYYVASNLPSLKRIVSDAIMKEMRIAAVQLPGCVSCVGLYGYEARFILDARSAMELLNHVRNLANAYIELNREAFCSSSLDKVLFP